jgi:hypothetical protein
MLPDEPSAVDLSIVVPIFNEEGNVVPLAEEIRAVLDPRSPSWEVVLVDDGSSDGTAAELERLAAADPRVRVLRLSRRYGQTAALQAGFDHSLGGVVVTLDGDGQNDPRDVPRLLDALDAGWDVVSGWRRERRDDFLSRILPSRIANFLIRKVTGTAIHDHGCGLKAYRREVVEKLRLYGDLHRFILVVTTLAGCRYGEVPVRHRPRCRGCSKYGVSRIWSVLLDLLALTMITRFQSRPTRWFALLGVPLLLAAVACGGAAAVQYLTADAASGFPLVYPGATLLFAFGFLHLALLAFLGELAVATGDGRESESLLVRVDRGEGEASP